MAAIRGWQGARARRRADLITQQNESLRRQAEIESQRRLEAERQSRLVDRAQEICRQVESVNASMPRLVRESDRALDQARAEFEEGVFTPFWEATELAATKLAEFAYSIATIQECTKDYMKTCRELGRIPCQLNHEISPAVVEAAAASSEKLKAMAREAQRNRDFATIYEQRRTTAAVIRGFESLNQAVMFMGDRIRDSIQELSDTYSAGIRDLQRTNLVAATHVVGGLANVSWHLEGIAEEVKAGSEAQRKTTELLEEFRKKRR